jgi:polygalacturonase
MILPHRFHSFVLFLLVSISCWVCPNPVLAAPTLPNINVTNIITITNAPYNAVGDNATDNTTAIQNAINAATTGGNTNGLYGGTVRVPASGTFLCGPLTLKNNVNIQIDAGATLKMEPLSVWTNYLAQDTTYGNLIYAKGMTNLEISGSGTIDGNGANWWSSSGSVFSDRPYMIFFNGNCGQVLIQNVTIQNPPIMHIVFKGSDNNITIQGMTINTTAANAANTDGIDLVGTNCLVQNCTINAGDDNIALGSSTSSSISTDILVTNCTFGVGHGVSIGSNTAGAVSNLTVINCTFNGTDYGIRMKSSTNSSGGSGQGGLAQNLSYLNLGMTNIVDGAIVIYSYYDSNAGGQFGTPTSVSPYFASTQAVTTATVPVWRNITISNVNATVVSGGVPGIIWARMEVPATNILLSHVNITASQAFDVYNARGFQFADSKITVPSGTTTFLLYNAPLIITNSVFSTNLVTLDGLTTNGYGNSLAFYNARTSLKNTNVFDDGPLTIADSTFTISNNFMLFPGTVLNYTLDSNTNQVAVVGNLALGGTINVTNGSGFGAGTYTLLTYTGTLSSNLPTLGSTPGSAYTYSFNTNTAGQVNFVVTSTNTSPTPTTNAVQSSANPSTYGTTVIFTATVSPAPTNGETVTFKDGPTTLGTGTLSGGQATFNTTATQLATGAHSITAVYVGDGAYGASTSSALSQTVNPLGLTVSGLTISNKVYDGTAAATLITNGYALNTVIGGDVVTLVTNGYTANFASANVANGITVTVTGLSLGGAQATNYTLTQPTGLTANITPAGSSILLGSSANPVAHLSGVSFTANVTPSTLGGSVLFLTNGVAFNSQTLSGGTATSVTTVALPRGTNIITAQYSGNSNYSPSTNTLNQVVTNNPPVANPAIYYRLVGYPLTIVITNLATNWSDLDGDPLVLAGTDASSTNGGTVTYDSTNIYYSDSNSVTDQFGYTISDGQGGTTSGIITVLMAQQTISGWTINSNGSVTLSFSGIPGNTYWVATTTNLTPPVVWMTISTNTAGTNGLWQFTDTQAANFFQRFYRTQLSH